jgi:protein-tyrosine phosphatase
VLNLQTDEDMQVCGLDWGSLSRYYWQRRMQLERVPIRDFDPVDLRRNLEQAVAVLDHLIRSDHCVYVHCTAGFGRAPAVAIAWLAWCQDRALQEAVHHVKTRRTCAPFVEAIRQATQDRAG